MGDDSLHVQTPYNLLARGSIVSHQRLVDQYFSGIEAKENICRLPNFKAECFNRKSALYEMRFVAATFTAPSTSGHQHEEGAQGVRIRAFNI